MNKFYESGFTIKMREGGVVHQRIWKDSATENYIHIETSFDADDFPSRQSIAWALLDIKKITANTFGPFDCSWFDTLIAQYLDSTPGSLNPPDFGEFILTVVLKRAHAEAVVGDLNEHFTRDYEKFGYNRAVRLYWARTLRSVAPLLWRAVVKGLKWGPVIAAVRRLF